MSDLISRQAAIDELDKGAWGVEWDKALAKAMIESLPSVTPKADMCDDTISREAIYEALSEWDKQDVYLPYHFKELVAELPPVTPEAKWIPVEEELPPSHEAVLLYVKYKSSGQWTYQLGMWNDNKQVWEDWRAPYQLEEEFEVIAWMELPEGYEEGNHE